MLITIFMIILLFLIVFVGIYLYFYKRENYECKNLKLDKRDAHYVIRYLIDKYKPTLLDKINQQIAGLPNVLSITKNCTVSQLNTIKINDIYIITCDDKNLCTNMSSLCYDDKQNQYILNITGLIKIPNFQTTITFYDDVYKYNVNLIDIDVHILIIMKYNCDSNVISIDDIKVTGYKISDIQSDNTNLVHLLKFINIETPWNIVQLLNRYVISFISKKLPITFKDALNPLMKKIVCEATPSPIQFFESFNNNNLHDIDYTPFFFSLLDEITKISIQYYSKHKISLPCGTKSVAQHCRSEENVDSSFIYHISTGCQDGTESSITDDKHHSGIGYLDICYVEGVQDATISNIENVKILEDTVLLDIHVFVPKLRIGTYLKGGSAVDAAATLCLLGGPGLNPRAGNNGLLLIDVDNIDVTCGCTFLYDTEYPNTILRGMTFSFSVGESFNYKINRDPNDHENAKCILYLFDLLKPIEGKNIHNKIATAIQNYMEKFSKTLSKLVEELEIPFNLFIPQQIQNTPVLYSTFYNYVQNKNDSTVGLDLKTCDIRNPTIDINGNLTCKKQNVFPPNFYFVDDTLECRNLYVDENNILNISCKQDNIYIEDSIPLVNCPSNNYKVTITDDHELNVSCITNNKYILEPVNERNLRFVMYKNNYPITCATNGPVGVYITDKTSTISCLYTYQNTEPILFQGYYYNTHSLAITNSIAYTDVCKQTGCFTLFYITKDGYPVFQNDNSKFIILKDINSQRYMFINEVGEAINFSNDIATNLAINLSEPTDEWEKYLFGCVMLPYNTPYFSALPFNGSWSIDDEQNSSDNYIVNVICNMPFDVVPSYIRIGISGAFFSKINDEDYENVMQREKVNYPSIDLSVYDRYLCDYPCSFTFTIYNNYHEVTYKFELVNDFGEFGGPGPYHIKITRVDFDRFDINYLLSIWLLDSPYIAFIGS